MAQRYGSTYSPNASEKPTDNKTPPKRPFDNARASKVGARSNFLFLAALPLGIKAFQSEPVVMAGYLAALGCLVLAAWLTREGLKAEEAFEARNVARRPAIPRKIFGSILTGAGLGLVGLFGWGMVETVIFAVLGATLHTMAFGIDPLRNKGMGGVDKFQQDRVARAVDEAEAHLTKMQDAVARLNDRAAERRLASFTATARDMFRSVEEDPRELTAARKYLGVYLLGARDATVKYAEIWTRSRDAEARKSWFELLDDLEQNFSARTQKFLLENKTDLDIEIDVLRDRLAREGIRE